MLRLVLQSSVLRGLRRSAGPHPDRRLQVVEPAHRAQPEHPQILPLILAPVQLRAGAGSKVRYQERMGWVWRHGAEQESALKEGVAV